MHGGRGQWQAGCSSRQRWLQFRRAWLLAKSAWHLHCQVLHPNHTSLPSAMWSGTVSPHASVPLLASQTGKKFVLRRVLPALLAESPIFGVGKPDEARVIKLDLAALPVCQVCGRTGSGVELGNLRRVGGLQFGVGWIWAICWEACPQALYMVTCQEVATRQSHGGTIASLGYVVGQ